ncbi:sensor histidine kinase [Terrimonas pollutisoli]|uniref:sensor histidine kinase n=1 Tax=Terrimonas pollutisoli TaxID=3034147 RepID=UPI0023EB5ED7|nr:ATP-binding protein [Terrimonas sp. H1YJ31]
MNRLRWLAILMGAVILVITGFQVYWLRDNYKREQKSVEIRVQSLFRETVRDMQDSVLQNKLRDVLKDSSVKTRFRKRSLDGDEVALRNPPRTARVLNILNKQLLRDSSKGKKDVFISLNKDAAFRKKDSSGKPGVIFDSLQPRTIDKMIVVTDHPSLPQNQAKKDEVREISVAGTLAKDSIGKSRSGPSTIYFNTGDGDNFRIRIDSLFTDSIPVEKISSVFSKKLQEQNLAVPFTISYRPETFPLEEDFFRRAPPVDSFAGYKIQLGNAFSFLLKKISLPILFSVFLVGLTVASFILLYRSLLRQHRLAQLKNDLISNITHELKTPIATVAVAIEALKNFNAMQDPSKTKEYLDISQNELQRLGLLVDKVLKLSMFENKEMELKYELFDLEEVVNEVVASLRLQLEKYNARIVVNTEGNLLIKGDRTHLLSVVFNLLDNALKYSKGNTAIQVDIKEQENVIELKITDNGIGIPAEYREKIFEKFFRVPTGDTHNAKGHGLGLSYVAKVIQRHHGSIDVNSHEGLGSTFTIRLPKTANA